MSNLDAVTFGEAMVMFTADEPGPLHEVIHYTSGLAGAEMNVAIGLARLGLRSGWVSKVGNDSFGNLILRRLEEEGVDISQVQIDEQYPTGFQLKSKVWDGDPEIQYFRKGSAASYMGVEDFAEEYYLGAAHLHMTGIPLAISEQTREYADCVLQCMKREGRTVSFDPNLRPALWKSQQEMIDVVNKFAFEANYVLPGASEGYLLTGYSEPGDMASFYLEKGVELVIVKLGEGGAYYKTPNEEGQVSAFPVEKTVDTVGAGDGFAVGVISALIEKRSIVEAVQRGNAIGSLAVQSPGDYDGYPTREQLQHYMLNQQMIRANR
ncbi:sugar kinase [Paenibacillus phocaensis]|uniref:sugar kinase n=1 Tax=Paenibacillus phocaensis TaxID=1776378 RepID=UPI000AF17096|nr:sugar kinase [Paenibacillus phocaensis]